MAVALVTTGTEGAAASGDVTVGAPASPSTNDVWICAVHSTDNVAHTFTDWTELFQANGGGSLSRLSVWYHRYAGSTPNLTVGHTAGDTIIAGIASWSGVKTSGSPANVVGSGGGGTDMSIEHTAITPGVDNCMILAIFGIDDNRRVTEHSGYTPALEDTADAGADAYVTNLGTDGAVGIHYLLQGTAADTGTITTTIDGAAGTRNWASVLIALEPAAVAAATSLLFRPVPMMPFLVR